MEKIARLHGLRSYLNNEVFRRVTKPTLLLGFGLVSLLFFLMLGFLRERFVLVHTFDTGLYMQLLQNIIRDGDWSSSVTGEQNFLAHHFQPILLLIVPFFYIFPYATTLFSISVASILTSILMIKKRYHEKLTPVLLGAFLISAIWHPSLAGRIFNFFCPDIIALPLLLHQAFCLADKGRLENKQIVNLVIIQMLAGYCKETIWLVNAFVALILAFQNRAKSKIFMIICLSNLLVFSLIFFFYMRQNTVMSSYYGLSYYAHPSVTQDGKLGLALSMLLNLISGQSLFTLGLTMIGLSGVIPFARISSVLLAALPGMVFILATNHHQIHLPIHQYLILCLPFFWVSGLEIIRNKNLPPSFFKFEKFIPILLVIGPVSVTGYEIGKNIWRTNKYQNLSAKTFVREDLDLIKKEIASVKNPVLLVDAELQPLLSDFKEVITIFEFKGNPKHLTEDDKERITNVITLMDPRMFFSCTLKITDEKTNLLDTKAFYNYCRWMQSNTFQKDYYPRSRLNHFRI